MKELTNKAFEFQIKYQIQEIRKESHNFQLSLQGLLSLIEELIIRSRERDEKGFV